MSLRLPPAARPASAGRPDSRCRRAGLATTLASLAAALAAAMPLAAQGEDSFASGHAVFERAGCNTCHLFASRRMAPSIRDMMRDFAGDPLAVAAATRASRAHQLDTRFPSLPEDDLRSIAQWLGAAAWPEADADTAAADPAAAATPADTESALATREQPGALPAAALETPAPAAVVPALTADVPGLSAGTPAASPPRVAVSAIRIEKGKPRSDRLIVDLSGGEPEMVDMQVLDGSLLVVLTGARLGTAVPPRRADWPGSSVVGAVSATDRSGSVELAIEAKVAAWTYSGTQGKRRLVIDLTAANVQPDAGHALRAEVAKAATPLAPTTVPAATKASVAPAILAPPPTPAAKASPPPAKASHSPVAKAAVPPAAKKAVVPAAPVAAAPVAAAPVAAAPATAATADAPKIALPSPPVVAAASLATSAAAAPVSPAAAASEPATKPEAGAPKLALAAPAAAPPAKAKATKGKADADLAPCPPATPEEQVIGQFDPRMVKEILDRIGCPQCHAYAQKKTGSPFRDIIKKYKDDPACVMFRLRTNQTHKDEGVVRDTKPEEYKLIADYVATRAK